jgi:hypothetical protein
VGTTTLCAFLGDCALDSGTTAPEWTGQPIVVVAAGTAPSVAKAVRLVGVFAALPLSIRMALAVVSDSAAPEPGLVRSRLRAVEPAVAGVVRFPYVEAWRYLDDPMSQPVPTTYQRSLRSLCHLINTL